MAESPVVFDRDLLRARRRRAAALGPATFLIDYVAKDFSDRLAAVLRRFELTVDLGTPTDAIRRVLAASGKVGRIIHSACGNEQPNRNDGLFMVLQCINGQAIGQLACLIRREVYLSQRLRIRRGGLLRGGD